MYIVHGFSCGIWKGRIKCRFRFFIYLFFRENFLTEYGDRKFIDWDGELGMYIVQAFYMVYGKEGLNVD